MEVSKLNINNLLNVSDSSDSGTSTLMYTRSSAESSPNSSASLSLICLEDQSASEPSQTSSSLDDLYFVPAKLQEVTDRSFGGSSSTSIEEMLQLHSEVGIESQETVQGYTPVKLQTVEDCERTPNGMPRLSPVLEAAKKVFPRSPFQSRRPKQLVMCLKRKRSGGFRIRKAGIKKIIEASVKKELKGLECRITQSISSTIKGEVLSVVQQQLKESLGSFRGPVERGVQKNRSARSKAKSKGSVAGNNGNMETNELDIGNIVGSAKASGAASSAIEGRTVSEEAKLQKPEEETEKTKTPSPAKRSTAFGALLKYVHSKTLLEKLTASMEKNSNDKDDQDDDSDSSFGSVENNALVKPSGVPKMVSVDSLKDISPSSSLESSPDKENQNNMLSIPKTSTTSAQPVLNIAKPTGRITWSNTCKALVPYVRTSSVATKIIIGLPKPNPELLSKHELATRKYKEALACDFCGKHFYNNSSLKQHTSFHRPHRPYQCEHMNCNKAYKTRSELNRHLVVHSGEKNFECRQCGKRFLRKQYLKTHLLRHEEALIWNCNLCSKMFVNQHDLDKHKVSYHKNGKRTQRVEELPQRLPISYSIDDLRA